MRVRTGENPSQITSDHPDGARLTPRADSSEPLGRASRPSPPDPAAPEAPEVSAAPAAPEVPAGVPGLTALSDDHSDELEPSPREECGVFGVWAPGEEVSRLTYFGLYALQHRGQESAGIAVSDGGRIAVYKDIGLVSQVFDEATLTALSGHIAVGHCRYSTTGVNKWANAQPTLGATADDGTVALAHNGNLVNSAELLRMVHAADGRHTHGEMKQGNTTDTALVTALLHGAPGDRLEETALELLPKIRGAYCFVFMDERTLYAARDPQGVRPLVLGRLERGWVVASEQSALATVGASFIREVEPGEMIAIDEEGIRSTRFAESKPAGCVFEYVYLARPDATIAGRSVYESRVEMGRRLALEQPVEADVVIPVPESGTPAAVGYADASGLPFRQGFVKNAYVGRTFIQPSQTLRQLGIRLKLNVQSTVVAGKRVVVVDDSIVRGNTQRAVVRMLREAGAAEVHVKISSPPVKWPASTASTSPPAPNSSPTAPRWTRSPRPSAPTRWPTSARRA